jgi:hypothetical protein
MARIGAALDEMLEKRGLTVATETLTTQTPASDEPTSGASAEAPPTSDPAALNVELAGAEASNGDAPVDAAVGDDFAAAGSDSSGGVS